MEKNLRANKASLQLPKRIELALPKSRVSKNQPPEKERPSDDATEKYISPGYGKKAPIGPSDQQNLHRKLRAILSRKSIAKPSSTQVSQVG